VPLHQIGEHWIPLDENLCCFEVVGGHGDSLGGPQLVPR
jgi:hypothetical protein